MEITYNPTGKEVLEDVIKGLFKPQETSNCISGLYNQGQISKGRYIPAIIAAQAFDILKYGMWFTVGKSLVDLIR